MSAESLSRRTFGDITFQGVNITKSLRPYFLSLCYTDNEDGEGDDLQICLQDRAGLWREKVNAAASGKFKVKADIVMENWKTGRPRKQRPGKAIPSPAWPMRSPEPTA